MGRCSTETEIRGESDRVVDPLAPMQAAGRSLEGCVGVFNGTGL